MNTLSILEILKKAARTTDILLNMLIGDNNYQKLKRKAFYPTLPEFSEKKDNILLLQKRRHNLYSLFYQLKKQGFIKKEQKRGKTFWMITLLGNQRLNRFKNIIKLPQLSYKKEKDDGLNIVAFDIPEKYKTKRNWLRKGLLILDFAMLQKSVWMGENKLPKNFIKDLEELEIIKFIHIFKVSKTGTLKKY